MMNLAEVVTENTANVPWYFFLLIPFIFIGTWCLICFLLSRLGGWAGVAKEFRANHVPTGTKLFGQAAQFGGFCNYNGCLTIIIADEGLYLDIWQLFRIGHPALLIPWDELHNAKQSSFLWMKQVRFDVGKLRITSIRVSQKIAKMLPEGVGRI